MIYLVGDRTSVEYELRVRICGSFWSRLLGALPEGGIPDGEGVLLPGCRRIHTWFMRESIAVMFLSEEGRITEYHPRVKPFRIVSGTPGSRATLELAPERLELDLRNDRRFWLRLDPSTALRAGKPEWSLERGDSEASRRLRNG